MKPCPEGATSQSPGLPLLLPWELKHEGVNRIAVASDAVQPKLVRNRVAVERLGYSLPRVAEAATLGFERQDKPK